MNTNIQIFSKKQINRSGEYLAKIDSIDECNETEVDQHLEVFNYWRNLHSYVMNLIYINLKSRLKKLEIKNSLIVQRLKRKESILNKLKRFNNMQLSRMQDLAGVRIIVKKWVMFIKLEMISYNLTHMIYVLSIII